MRRRFWAVVRVRDAGSKLESRTAYLLIAPLFILLGSFVFFPAIFSFYVSLFHYDPFNHNIYYVGYSNYLSVFNSPLFRIAVINVLIYAAVVVTIQTFLAFSLALLFNRRFLVSKVSRAFVFLPAITSSVAMSIIFIWFFSKQGLLNYILAPLGVAPENWLFSTTYAFPSIMMLNIFSTSPYFMIMYLAGLQSIPSPIMEAAAIDGVVSPWSKFRYFYFPMLTFTTLFVVILGIIGCIQLFDQVFVMTDGGPAYATYVPMIFIFNRAYLYPGMIGVSAAASFMLFIIIMTITVAQRNFLKEMKW
ncbi:MAG: sugar ABC transporter permease [Thermoplasmata archaeon]|nr:sugar ABC transporter permease [Candidatus Sysuiplasma acidicola]MBX8638478.1 sugar ABC transporter permease [Candidatus Sysuiplasma acidicola]MBX8646480.1 sugar ABC transporter permease [Candidatus Sysuiplasma acidicola]